MAPKIKYTRKDLKGPDEFLTTMGMAVAWFRENRGKAIAAGMAVVLAAGGVFGTRAYFRWQETKATRDLWPHLNRAQEYLQSPGQVDKEKLARLEQFLAAHVNAHPDTRTAVFARYHLGSIAYLRGEYDLSAAQFRAALASGKGQGTIMDFLVREGLAQALEARGDADQAQRMYGEAATFATGELRSQAWLGQARTLSLLGRVEEAEGIYRKILAETPQTPFKDLIEIKLAHIR